MELIRNLCDIKSHHKDCMLAVGNFDGFHRGHQSLIVQLQQERLQYQLPIVVMIFEPQPKEYLSNSVTSRLTRLRDKVRYLCAAGVDVVLCIKFNKQFASIEPVNFVKNILVSKLRVRRVYIGGDFRFGAFRKGDFVFLKRVSKYGGFEVIRVTTCFDKNGQKISSSAIRTALIEDRILDAELLLGHSYCVSGRVIRGNSIGGCILGFPTANISLQGKRLPIHGVYAVEVHGVFAMPLPGVANIGMRPTVTGGAGAQQQQLEVHLLNISVNLYTCHIKVVILSKIRNEQYFSSVQKLQNQIKYDVMRVRDYFNKKLLHQKFLNTE